MTPAPPLKPSVPTTKVFRRRREAWLGWLLVLCALVLGGFLQLALPPGPVTLIVVAGAFAVALLAPALAGVRVVRDLIAGYRFAGVLLAAIGVVVMTGTLLPPYAKLFKTLWFAALIGLFVAAIVVSALRRFPPTWKTLGFFLCHVGLLLILAGGALSSLFAVRGRIDLHTTGPAARSVAVTAGGQPTGERASLPFAVKLADFRVDRYAPDHRVALYQVLGDGRARQLAAFDPDVGVAHRLPDGARYRVKAAAGSRAVVVELTDEQGVREAILSAAGREALFFGGDKAITYERRPPEVKAYHSTLAIEHDGRRRRADLAVNAPLEVAGWTLYQANYNPEDPTYSGLEAVHDPGVPWVFAGFALVAFGVPYMLNVAPWLRRRAAGGQS